MVRDKVAEIAEIRMRGQRLGHSRAQREIIELFKSWSSNNVTIPYQFIVIRLVTIIEVFTRDWVAMIIDAGDPYTNRGADLVKGALKIDFALAQALIGRRISFGDLISHDISTNSIGDIEKIFSKLLNLSFFDHLEGIVDRWKIEVEGKSVAPFMPDATWAKSIIAKLFVRRNIIVHELPECDQISYEEIDQYINACSQFINASVQVFMNFLYGEYPLTQAEMNVAAYEKAKLANEEMIEIIKSIDSNGQNTELQISQEAWVFFRDREAEFTSGINAENSGSMTSMLHSLVLEKLTRDRIQQLESHGIRLKDE